VVSQHIKRTAPVGVKSLSPRIFRDPIQYGTAASTVAGTVVAEEKARLKQNTNAEQMIRITIACG
jgi:hypothetical protein